MEFRQVRYFLEIIEKGSFQKAADSLGLTQPALSSQIAILEREFGETILERGPREIKLTYKGEIFRSYAEKMKELWRNCEEDMNRIDSEINGKFSVSAGGTVSAWILPKIIKQILNENPRLSLSVIEGDASETKDLVLSGKADLGILTGPVKDPHLVTKEFLVDEIVPVVSKFHPLSGKTKITEKDVRKEPFIFFHPASAVRIALEKKWRAEKISFDPKILMELRSVESIIKSVEEGLGIGFISRFSVSENLKVLPLQELAAERKFFLCYKKNSRSGLLLLVDAILKWRDSL
ncbi:LysR family transcriptional regulator [Leptospira idonii]|uniref:LysR family transcriptional regulator n=1 Tax=Leptospira idonii TaxID=1193500 RepID=A0A4R9LWW3_9LEPT|nr:LysR family transcriptional regulator [Leptospira idonii]TGN18740.1 LysR family transcriptional regulator [Leptospira idonii]